MFFSNKEQASCGFKPLSRVVQFPQVLCLTGEGVTLKVPSSIMAHELRRMVLEKLPTKKGAKLVLHHLHSKLLLGQSLQEQGILGETATLSCTYDPWKRKVFFLFFPMCFACCPKTCGIDMRMLLQKSQDPLNLYAAWQFARFSDFSDDHFSEQDLVLEGVTHLSGATSSQFLYHLPRPFKV